MVFLTHSVSPILRVGPEVPPSLSWQGEPQTHLALAGLQQALLNGKLHDLVVLVLHTDVLPLVVNAIGFGDLKDRLVHHEGRGWSREEYKPGGGLVSAPALVERPPKSRANGSTGMQLPSPGRPGEGNGSQQGRL